VWSGPLARGRHAAHHIARRTRVLA
jgi:hypothetical protein